MRALALQRRTTDIPNSDAVLLFAVVVIGIVAASTAEPMLWYFTPIVAFCLLVASVRAARASASELPSALQEKVEATLAQLPTGEIRALFNDIVGAASQVFSKRVRRLSDHYARDTQDSVTELVDAACHVAIDAARVDQSLRSGTLLQRDPSFAASMEKARTQYTSQLAEVTSTLNALVASGLAHGTPESERVAELIAAIRSETTARNEAWKEIDSLLS